MKVIATLGWRSWRVLKPPMLLPQHVLCCLPGCCLVHACATAAPRLPHLEAVKAAAIVDLQERKGTSSSLTACLHPATNP
jgi:hypothetical protein